MENASRLAILNFEMKVFLGISCYAVNAITCVILFLDISPSIFAS